MDKKKNNFKLIVIDLDGTLIGRDLLISKRNKQAIKRAIKKNIIVTLATGRTYQTTAPYAAQLGIKVPVICYQGAVIKNSIQTLKYSTLKLKIVKEIIKEGIDCQTQICLYFSDCAYLNKPLTKIGYQYLNEVELLREVRIVDLTHYYFHSEPLKIMFINSAEKIKKIIKKISHKFNDKVYFTISAPTYLEFLDRQASKGQALKEFRKYFKLKKEETIAIGDNYNDISLLEEAGLGVAMGNAVKAVKKKADLVTKAVDRDGVAQVIEKFIL